MLLRKRILINIVSAILLMSLFACSSGPNTLPVGSSDPTEAPVDEELLFLDKNLTYYSSGQEGWQNTAYALHDDVSGKFSLKFNMTPKTTDSTLYLGFAGNGANVMKLTDNAILVRFNGSFIHATNGSKFESVTEMPYDKNKAITFDLTVNADHNTYTLFALSPGNPSVLIADNYDFNPFATGTANIGKVFFISDEDEQFSIEGLGTIRRPKPGDVFYSAFEGNSWQSSGVCLGKAYTGKVKIEFDMAADRDNLDGSVNFTDADFAVAEYANMAVQVRMHSNGLFDVRNGDQGQMAEVSVPYTGGVEYHIEIHVETESKTYDVWITPPGQDKIQIAKNYGFRATSNHADDLGQIFMYSAESDRDIKMTNFRIAEVESFDEDITGEPGGTAQPVPTTAKLPTEPTATAPKPSGDFEYWLVPDANIYRINGTNYLAYYPTLEKSTIKSDVRTRANQINEMAARHPDVKVYAYYITKTEDLDWFDESEGIKAFDYYHYMTSFFTDAIGFDKLDIETFADLEKMAYMTDHHWNHKGVQQGYEDTMKLLSVDFDLPPVKIPLEELDFGKKLTWLGSKFRKSGGIKNVDPDSFLAYKYDLGQYETYVSGVKTNIGRTSLYESGNAPLGNSTDHYDAYYGGHTDLVEYEFPGNKYNCLMIGDSNCFPIRKLIASHFTKLYYIDKYVLSNYAIDDFIKDNDINAVVFMGQLDLFEKRAYQLQGYPTD